MIRRRLKAGFIPLVDAAPLVIAREIGFAREESLQLELERAPSWSTLRDWLAVGAVDAAHMLSPVPVAAALRLGAPQVRLNVLSVLSVNGNVIGTSLGLARRMRMAGFDPDFADAARAGAALKSAARGTLRIGVPFPFSMHAELLNYWLDAAGLTDVDVQTVPPPLMADALAAGEIDAFCVGEPWGSIAVENGAGSLLLPGKAIWAGAPEKVLAVRESWAAEHSSEARRLIRALWRAGRWLSQPQNRFTAAEILSRPEYLNISAEILDRAFAGQFVASPSGGQIACADFVAFHGAAAGFPWQSQAAWIGRRLARRAGLAPMEAQARAAATFRSDLYRQALAPLHAGLPGAPEKLEGVQGTAPAAGALILAPGRFFDGRIFDPGSED